MLVSVPGTEQAKDAVLMAQVPTVMEVNPTSAAAQVNVVYNGAPEFKAIEGTSFSYATNTADKVIKVGDVYYLCLHGVWFMSSNPAGPWTTAPSVPSAIYTIPPSSPVYNVTYVTQTTTSSGNVQSSYTAGYLGSFIVGIGVGAIIAGGTGYYYPPYYYYGVGYPIYRPYAATYGYGSYYNSYTGAYGVAHGVYGPYGGATGFASYNPYTGTYARGGSVYGPYGSASAGRAYNPYTGAYARGGSVSTAYGTRSAASGYNPSTGVGAATRQGSSPYGQWGSSVVSNGNRAVQTGHVSNSQGTIAGARSTTGAAVVGGSGNNGSGGVARSSSGDLYAAKDGNVYKNTGSGWENAAGGSANRTTSQANRTAAQSGAAARPQASQMQGLNQEMQNRQRGAAQTQSFQNFQRGGGGAVMVDASAAVVVAVAAALVGLREGGTSFGLTSCCRRRARVCGSSSTKRITSTTASISQSGGKATRCRSESAKRSSWTIRRLRRLHRFGIELGSKLDPRRCQNHVR